MLFNQNDFFSWQSFKDVKYDGVRIYYGRYDKTTAARGEDIGKNTLVLILTQKNKDGVYEDIIPGVKEVPVLPLNDGSRCKPNCNGNILFNPETK